MSEQDQNAIVERAPTGSQLASHRAMDFVDSLEDRYRLSKVMVQSGMLPRSVDTPQKALTIMLKGSELGVPPMQAMSSIHVIKGKPTLSGELMMALCIRDADCRFEIERRDKDGAAVTIHRPGHGSETFEFTREDAKRAGLTGKENWRKYPQAMHYWRAVSAACKAVCPDVVAGMYTPEELNPDAEIEPSTGGLANAQEVAAETTDADFEIVEATEDQLGRIDELLDELEGLNPERAEKAGNWVDAQGDLTEAGAEKAIKTLETACAEEQEAAEEGADEGEGDEPEADTEALHRKYFATLKEHGVENDGARHDLNLAMGLPESTKDWDADDYREAIDQLEHPVDDELAPIIEELLAAGGGEG